MVGSGCATPRRQSALAWRVRIVGCSSPPRGGAGRHPRQRSIRGIRAVGCCIGTFVKVGYSLSHDLPSLSLSELMTRCSRRSPRSTSASGGGDEHARLQG